MRSSCLGLCRFKLVFFLLIIVTDNEGYRPTLRRAFFGQQVLLNFLEPERENRKTVKPPACRCSERPLVGLTVFVRSNIGSECRLIRYWFGLFVFHALLGIVKNLVTFKMCCFTFAEKRCEKNSLFLVGNRNLFFCNFS